MPKSTSSEDDYLPPDFYYRHTPNRTQGFEKFTHEGVHYFCFYARKKVVLLSQAYASASGRDNGIASVKKNMQIEKRYRFSERENGQFAFSLLAGNHQEIAMSCDFSTLKQAENMASFMGDFVPAELKKTRSNTPKTPSKIKDSATVKERAKIKIRPIIKPETLKDTDPDAGQRTAKTNRVEANRVKSGQTLTPAIAPVAPSLSSPPPFAKTPQKVTAYEALPMDMEALSSRDTQTDNPINNQINNLENSEILSTFNPTNDAVLNSETAQPVLVAPLSPLTDYAPPLARRPDVASAIRAQRTPSTFQDSAPIAVSELTFDWFVEDEDEFEPRRFNPRWLLWLLPLILLLSFLVSGIKAYQSKAFIPSIAESKAWVEITVPQTPDPLGDLKVPELYVPELKEPELNAPERMQSPNLPVIDMIVGPVKDVESPVSESSSVKAAPVADPPVFETEIPETFTDQTPIKIEQERVSGPELKPVSEPKPVSESMPVSEPKPVLESKPVSERPAENVLIFKPKPRRVFLGLIVDKMKGARRALQAFRLERAERNANKADIKSADIARKAESELGKVSGTVTAPRLETNSDFASSPRGDLPVSDSNMAANPKVTSPPSKPIFESEAIFETPIERSVEIPVEIPVETPVELPVERLVEASADPSVSQTISQTSSNSDSVKASDPIPASETPVQAAEFGEGVGASTGGTFRSDMNQSLNPDTGFEACGPSENILFNVPQNMTPINVTRLGTMPEFGDSHGLTPLGFYQKLNQRYQTRQYDQQFLDFLFRSMGYENGFKEARPEMFSDVKLAVGAKGVLGFGDFHGMQVSQLNVTDMRDLEAFSLKSANGRNINFMKTCGNFMHVCQ